MNEPKFQPRTGYSKALIEEMTGEKTTTSEHHGTISAVDALGDYSQYDFYKEGDYYYLLAVDGEGITTMTTPIQPSATLKSRKTGAIFTVTKVLPEHVVVKSGEYRGCFPLRYVEQEFEVVEVESAGQGVVLPC